MQIGISDNAFLNLRLGLGGERIGYDREALRARRGNFSQCRSMERLGIAATQGECADILGIKRLPADRYLRLLRIILTVRRPARENSRRQHSRGIVAVPFFSFGKVHLEAVEAQGSSTWDW